MDYWYTPDAIRGYVMESGMMIYYNSTVNGLSSIATITRAADNSYTQGRDGLWVPAAPDTPRYKRGRLLIEPAITQPLNNNNTGASVGTLPTYWGVSSTMSGVRVAVTGLGDIDVDLGLPYVDLRFYGTPTSPGSVFVSPNAGLFSSVSRRNNYTISYWAKAISGSFPSGLFFVPDAMEASDASTIIEGTEKSFDYFYRAPRLTYTRYRNTLKPLSANCTHLNVRAKLYFPNSEAIDFTVRFSGFMLEPSSSPTSPVINGTTPGTRNADIAKLSASRMFPARNRTVIVDGNGKSSTRINWDGALATGEYRSIRVYSTNRREAKALLS